MNNSDTGSVFRHVLLGILSLFWAFMLSMIFDISEMHWQVLIFLVCYAASLVLTPKNFYVR